MPCLTPELWPTPAAASGGGPDPPDEPKACESVAESVPPCDDSRQWVSPEALVASIALPVHAPRGHNPNPPARLAADHGGHPARRVIRLVPDGRLDTGLPARSSPMAPSAAMCYEMKR